MTSSMDLTWLIHGLDLAGDNTLLFGDMHDGAAPAGFDFSLCLLPPCCGSICAAFTTINDIIQVYVNNAELPEME